MRRLPLTFLIAGVAGAVLWSALPHADGSPPPAVESRTAAVVAAAPGRIEGAAAAIEIGASVSGVVQDILVSEGDRIRYGQVMARIECRDLEAEVPQRVSDQHAAEAVYERLKNGSRQEEIRGAEAALQLAEARQVEADATKSRYITLSARAVTSHAQLLIAQRDADIAAAQVSDAQQHLTLLRTGPRLEEIAEALARAEAARHLVDLTRARLERCTVRSPIQGMVLRKHVSIGELYSIYMPRPLFTVANTEKYRVRAEVDETDALRISVGQKATVAVDHHAVTGEVVDLGRLMGRRHILTTDPADKSDRDVLDVIVELEPTGIALPVGLRVSVLFQEHR
jgi:HlyD family secretion protein